MAQKTYKIIALITGGKKVFYRTAVVQRPVESPIPSWCEAREIFGVREDDDWKDGSFELIGGAQRSVAQLARSHPRAEVVREVLRITVRTGNKSVVRF